MFRFVIFLVITISYFPSIAQQKLPPIDYVAKVNPLIGSNNDFSISHGNTLPLVTRPFGMTTWTAQTTQGGNWMYNYNDSLIHAFRATHQPSPWMGDFGTFNLMPSTGNPTAALAARGSIFSHQKEKASPHYYEVDLLSTQIKAGMTTTERCGFFEFTFPASNQSIIYTDVMKGGATLQLFSKENKIIGTASNNSGGCPSNFASYFVIYFDKPFADYGLFENGILKSKNIEVKADEAHAYLLFQTKDKEKIHARIGTSFISIAQAELNLKNEIGNQTFDQIKNQSHEVWNKEFSKIAIEGVSASEQTIFYSSYYRTLIFPSKFYEYNSANKKTYYSPYDGKVHEGVMYTNNGIWDTYRAVFPFFTIMQPMVHAEFCQSLVNAYKEGGWLPRWLSPGYREIMIGVHAASLFADAYTKGLPNIDYVTAYQAMLKDANEANPISIRNKEGLEHYNAKGYVQSTVRESVAKNLEYAYDDYCVSLVAKGLGKDADAKLFLKRANNFKNTFDGATNFMCAKDAKGRWRSPFNQYAWGGDYTEGNAWHYLWSVFHDPAGLINLMGGKENFTSKMDSVFTVPSLSDWSYYGFKIHEITELENAHLGQYAHGNQPIQHFIYLYNYGGQPWKSQYWARKIMTTLYGADQNGLCGDEDNGQTSAWYVMSALGFYPVCPGSGEYIFGSPLFAKATMTLPNGNKFVINAKNNTSENVYVQAAKLNKQPYTKTFLTHSAILKGGLLELDMTSIPNKNKGIMPADAPFSMSATSPFCSPPYSNVSSGIFEGVLNVTLATKTAGAFITYTLDGTTPTAQSLRYVSPIVISKTTVVKAKAFHATKAMSELLVMNFKNEMKKAIDISNVQSGIAYKYYEGNWELIPNLANSQPIKIGVLDNFALTPSQRKDMYAIEFEGYLKVPQSGIYTLYARTDDGCRIIIDDEIIHEADGRHGMEEYNEKVSLEKGLHKIKLIYNEIDGGEGINIQIEGGGLPKQIVGEGMLFH